MNAMRMTKAGVTNAGEPAVGVTFVAGVVDGEAAERVGEAYGDRSMVLPRRLEALTVFYDGRCGMCCTFHEWVNRQEKLARMGFVPYQSADAERLFPGIGLLEPEREMVVRDEGAGTVYRGAEAWVICLFALTEYRGWARRLSSPALLPVAKRTCALLARNRHRLSRVFFARKDREVAALLHRMPPPREACQRGGCGV